MSNNDIIAIPNGTANGKPTVRSRQERSVFAPGPRPGMGPVDSIVGLVDRLRAPSESPGANTGLRIEGEPLPCNDELFVRVKGSREGEVIYDEVLRSDSEQEIEGACQDLAAATCRSLQEVEQAVAQVITRERSRWNRTRQQGEQAGKGFLDDVVDSTAFDGATYRLNWLVRSVLVEHQPAIIGGPKKALKTSLMTDLAVSLGSGTPFLGKFEVPQAMRVLVISGESGQATLQETARRVARARGVKLDQCLVHWAFQLPKFAREQDLDRLEAYVRQKDVKAVVIDPVYLCMLDGSVKLSAANLFDTGPLLLRVSDACLSGGATPVLVHHARKLAMGQKVGQGEPLDLDDLAFAGFAEFARQWLLLSRRSPYDASTGTHKLWLNIGGSAGQGGLWGLNVDEGLMNTAFQGRMWQVRVVAPEVARSELAMEQDRKREEKKDQKKNKAHERILTLLKGEAGGETLTKLAERSGYSKEVTREVIEGLRQSGQIEEATVAKSAGRGMRDYSGWKIKRPGDTPTVQTAPTATAAQPTPARADRQAGVGGPAGPPQAERKMEVVGSGSADEEG